MSSKMMAALADALAAPDGGGLERARDGYRTPLPGSDIHPAGLCFVLVGHGYLLPYLDGDRMAITERGREYAAEARP